MHKMNQFGGYKKELWQVQANPTEAIPSRVLSGLLPPCCSFHSVAGSKSSGPCSEMHFARDSSPTTEAAWKPPTMKGKSQPYLTVVLPRISPEGIWLKVNHANNKNATQKHPLFTEGSLHDPSTDQHWRQECPGKQMQEEHRTGRMSKEKVTQVWCVKSENSPKQFFACSRNMVFG